MKVTKISAITLRISDMKKSVDFYSKIPNFKIVYGGSDSQFTSFLIDDASKSYLNLRINEVSAEVTHWSRIIFYVDDVDELFDYMENDETISRLGNLESKPVDAAWGERFFHVLDPDGYKLSFATPIRDE
jgi:catechol 2,3-dioxygenase-like lactoylglutathione lyase family enzyme